MSRLWARPLTYVTLFNLCLKHRNMVRCQKTLHKIKPLYSEDASTPEIFICCWAHREGRTKDSELLDSITFSYLFSPFFRSTFHHLAIFLLLSEDLCF